MIDMKILIWILLLASSVISCQEYKFCKEYDYVPNRKIETVYYGDHEDGYSAWSFCGLPMSNGGGTTYDSIINHYRKEAFNGPAVQYFESVTFRYGYENSEWVDYYYITDYIDGRDIGDRFFAYKNDQLVEFGYDYPSKRLMIQFDTLGNPMNFELYDYQEDIDVYFSNIISICMDVDSLREELLDPNWFTNHFEMTYTDSINGLSPLIERTYPATEGRWDY
jgi:hypothetical protein